MAHGVGARGREGAGLLQAVMALLWLGAWLGSEAWRLHFCDGFTFPPLYVPL